MSGVLDHVIPLDEKGRHQGTFVSEFADDTDYRGWYTDAELDEMIPNRVVRRVTWETEVPVYEPHPVLKRVCTGYEKVTFVMNIHYDSTRVDEDDRGTVTVQSPHMDTDKVFPNFNDVYKVYCHGTVFAECELENLYRCSYSKFIGSTFYNDHACLIGVTFLRG